MGLLGKNSGKTGLLPNVDTFKLKQHVNLSLPPYFRAFLMKATHNFGEEPSIAVWGKIVGQREEYTSVVCLVAFFFLYPNMVYTATNKLTTRWQLKLVSVFAVIFIIRFKSTFEI